MSAADFEADWTQLRRHLQYATDFWLGVVCASDIAAVNELRTRALALLPTQTRAAMVRVPATPEELVETLMWLDRDDVREAALVWVEAIYVTEAWRRGWETFFLRGNERRERWRRRLTGGLVVVGPPDLKVWMREAAPDLWSVRILVVELRVEPRESPQAPEAPVPEVAVRESRGRRRRRATRSRRTRTSSGRSSAGAGATPRPRSGG